MCIPYYLGSFDTNHIIYRNVEIFKSIFLKKLTKKNVKENIEISRIFYLSK